MPPTPVFVEIALVVVEFLWGDNYMKYLIILIIMFIFSNKIYAEDKFVTLENYITSIDKPKERINCNTLYQLALERERLEVQRLKQEVANLRALQFENDK